MTPHTRRPLTKERVKAWLERNFFLRLHMFFILSATFGSGLLATKILLAGGVNHLALRYALAVCAAYLVFLILIRIWLFYVRMARSGVDFSPDGVDWFTPSSGDAGGWGGGDFGGGGASGSWEGGAAPVKSGGGGGGGGKSSFSFDLGGDEGVVIVLFVALVLSLLVIGIYIIYTAPVLLSEAAFEAVLAATLVRGAKKIERPGWVGVVWRATLWPFLIVLALSIALGWYAHKHCPDAKKLREVFHCPPKRAV